MDFELLADSIEQVVYVIDKSYKLVYINKQGIAFLNKLGWKEPFFDQQINDFFPFRSQIILEEYNHVFKTGQTFHSSGFDEIAGKKYSYEIKKVPIKNNNTISQVLTIIDNLSNEKETLEKLKESEEKFRTAFYTSPSSINIHTLDGVYVDVNDGFTKLTGYTYEDVIGKTTSDINIWENPKDREKVLETISKKGIIENFVTDFKFKNGEVRTGLFSASIVSLNGKKHILSVTWDITERNALRKKLEESEWKYRTTFDIIREGLLDMDLTNNKSIFSDSFYVMLGYEPNEFENTNENWTSLLHPDDKIEMDKVVSEHFKGNIDQIFFEYRIKNKKGLWHWVKTKGKVVQFTEDGKPKRFLAAIEDIDTIKKYELDILEQNTLLLEKNTEIEEMVEHLQIAKEKAEESDRLKTLFLNNLSHEIRTPMNAIIGFSDFIDTPDTSEDERRNYVKIIKDSSFQLLKIVDDILEISMLQTKQVRPELKETCINDAMLKVFLLFDSKAKEKGIGFYQKNNLSVQESKVLMDKTKFLKIISSLVDNAIKFTNSGYVEMGCQISNNELRVYVKDTGVGIPEKKRKVIFKHFAQADREISLLAGGGLGIGLPIAKETAELLGGKIDLESVEGQGSKFIVSLPYNPVITNQQETDQKIYKVLVAEDEEINYIFVETLLKKYNKLTFEVKHAKNGIEAVELSKENSDLNLILMDIKMPLLSGYDATTQIKKLYPSLPIIALTAYSNPEDKKKAISAGCNGFISKPIDKDEFTRMLRKYIIKN